MVRFLIIIFIFKLGNILIISFLGIRYSNGPLGLILDLFEFCYLVWAQSKSPRGPTFIKVSSSPSSTKNRF